MNDPEWIQVWINVIRQLLKLNEKLVALGEPGDLEI